MAVRLTQRQARMLAEMGIPWPLQLHPADTVAASRLWIAVAVAPLTTAEARILESVLLAIEVAFHATTTKRILNANNEGAFRSLGEAPLETASGNILVLFGPDTTRLVLGADAESGTVVTNQGQAVITHSLAMLADEPMKKRELWEHLCKVRAAAC